MNQTATLSLIGLGIGVAVDRGLKLLALDGATAAPVNGGVRFELFPNPDIAFSIALPKTVTLVVVPIVLAIIIWLAIARLRSSDWLRAVLFFGVVLAAGSNYFDRLRYGYVVDYLSFGEWFPVFNLSDVMVVSCFVALWLVSRVDRRTSLE